MGLVLALLGIILVIPFVFGGTMYVIETIFDLLIDGTPTIKASLSIILFTLGMLCFAYADAETFEYKNGLTIEAPDYKTAAKLCFKKLNPVYVSEEAGLEIIDLCINPISGEVK